MRGNGEGSGGGENKTYQIEVIAILEAVVKLHNPLSATWRRYECSGLQDIALGTYVTFLSLAQHVRLTELTK